MHSMTNGLTCGEGREDVSRCSSSISRPSLSQPPTRPISHTPSLTPHLSNSNVSHPISLPLQAPPPLPLLALGACPGSRRPARAEPILGENPRKVRGNGICVGKCGPCPWSRRLASRHMQRPSLECTLAKWGRGCAGKVCVGVWEWREGGGHVCGSVAVLCAVWRSAAPLFSLALVSEFMHVMPYPTQIGVTYPHPRAAEREAGYLVVGALCCSGLGASPEGHGVGGGPLEGRSGQLLGLLALALGEDARGELQQSW